MKIKSVTFLLLLLSLNVQAQDSVRVSPENGIIDGSIIEPYTNAWEVFVLDSDGNETHIRYWTDYVHILDQDGVMMIHRVQDLYSADRNLQTTWINVTEQKTLQPIRFTVHNPSGALTTLQFAKDRVITGTNQNEDRLFVSDTTTFDEPLYDWNLYGMLLIGLPFKEGRVYELPFWNMQSKTKSSIFASIGKREEVETLSGKKYSTTPVTTSDGFTFSLSKKAPYVIRLIWDLPNGNQMIWKMK